MIRCYKVTVTTDEGITFTRFMECDDIWVLTEDHPTWDIKVEKF